MTRNRLLVLSLGLTLVTVWAGAAVAQAPYAPPTIAEDVQDRGLYRITLKVTAGANGSPAGFTVDWMKKSAFDALLGVWPAPGHPDLFTCDWYDAPTLNGWAGSPILNADEWAFLQVGGDLFDETGIYGNNYNDLEKGTAYVFRVRTAGDGNGDPSAYTETLTASTSPSECTQGFWKTHGPGDCHGGNNPDTWPASCFPMMLGTTNSYSQAEICSILLQPANGNGLISLAHQLITTLLNGCSTSDTSPVSTEIADAHTLIGSLVVPPVNGSTDFLAPASTSDLTETLDDYNNGLLGGVADCPTPVRTSTTWGRVKVLYR